MKVIVENSSSIKGLEYNNSELTVEFTGGSKYLYKGVNFDLVESLITSESKGKFFAMHIRDKFITEKLEIAPAPIDERMYNAIPEEFLEWTQEEEEAFLDVLNKPKKNIED